MYRNTPGRETVILPASGRLGFDGTEVTKRMAELEGNAQRGALNRGCNANQARQTRWQRQDNRSLERKAGVHALGTGISCSIEGAADRILEFLQGTRESSFPSRAWSLADAGYEKRTCLVRTADSDAQPRHPASVLEEELEYVHDKLRRENANLLGSTPSLQAIRVTAAKHASHVIRLKDDMFRA